MIDFHPIQRGVKLPIETEIGSSWMGHLGRVQNEPAFYSTKTSQIFTLKYEYVYNLYRNNCRRLPGGVYLDY